LAREEVLMTLREQMHANPFTWKDWIAAVSFVFTVATVFVQGGRILEQQQTANANIKELTAKMGSIQNEIIMQRGIDQLHDEQIRVLQRDVERLLRQK
jgi:hypothetical protein